MVRFCVLFVFSFLVSGVCWAEDVMRDGDILSLYGDEQMVSIATGHGTPLYKTPAVSSVLTSKDLEEMGARTVNDALETIPGIHVGVSPTVRMDSVYAIRGIQTNRNPHVLFMINGVAFNIGSTGGRPILFKMPISSVERIEVIRGPGSAIYGADAFSGVVNIVTKSFDTIDSEIGARAGSFDTYEMWLNHGERFGDIKASLSINGSRTSGDDDRIIKRDYQTQVDEVVGTRVSRAPGPVSTAYKLLDTHLELEWKDWTLRNWDWRQKDAGIGAGALLALDPDGTQNEHVSITELAYVNDHIKDWKFDISSYYYYYKSRGYAVIQPPGTTIPAAVNGVPFMINYPDGMIARPDGRGNLVGIDGSMLYSGVTNHQIRLGAGYRRLWQDIFYSRNFGPGVEQNVMTNVSDTPYTLMPNSKRENWYISLQDEWEFATDWTLTTGVRYDDYSDIGSTVNPRIALVWLTAQNLTTKLMYGRAFRAPSFAELYVASNPIELGNPSLSPEEIDTLELVFDYRPSHKLQTNLTLFGYRAEDLIEFVSAGEGTRTAENAKNLEGYGFELEALWTATETLKFQGNYSWQHTEDRKTGDRTENAPVDQLFVRSYWKFLPQWSLNTQVNWVGERYRVPEDPRGKAPDYTTVDITLHRANIFKNCDFKVAGRNIFDEDIREPSDGIAITEDLPMEGRSFWAEVSYTF